MCRLIDQILSDLVRFGLFLGIDIGYDRDGGVMDVDLIKTSFSRRAAGSIRVEWNGALTFSMMHGERLLPSVLRRLSRQLP